MTYSKVRLLIMIFIETDHKNHITSLNVFYRIAIFRLKKKNIKHFKRIKRNIIWHSVPEIFEFVEHVLVAIVYVNLDVGAV